MGVLGEDAVEVADGGSLLQPDHLRPGHHHLVHLALAETEDPLQEIAFLLAEGAFGGADVDEHAQLAFGDGEAARLPGQAEEAREGVGSEGKKVNDRRE